MLPGNCKNAKLQKTKLKEDKTEVHFLYFHCSDIVSFLLNAVCEEKKQLQAHSQQMHTQPHP